MISQNDIHQALIDVRNAYRLLHDYQRAALDAAGYIGSRLGFTYSGGAPNFSECSPRIEKGRLGDSSWNWLNMYYYDLFFTRECDDLKFSIFLFSDTGYFVSDHPAPEKTDIKTFGPAESSGTKLGFLFYRNWPADVCVLMNERGVLCRWIQDGELPPLLRERAVFAKCCDFARVCDEASTERVIAELVALAQTNGLAVEGIKKTA